MAAVHAHLEEGTPYVAEYRVRRKDGDLIGGDWARRGRPDAGWKTRPGGVDYGHH